MTDDFEDKAMIAAMQGRLANPELLKVDRLKLARASAEDAAVLTDMRAKSFIEMAKQGRNGRER